MPTRIVGRRVNEHDVMVTCLSPSRLDSFAAALRKAGLKVWKISSQVAQVSFDGYPALREALPPVGESYRIRMLALASGEDGNA